MVVRGSEGQGQRRLGRALLAFACAAILPFGFAQPLVVATLGWGASSATALGVAVTGSAEGVRCLWPRRVSFRIVEGLEGAWTLAAAVLLLQRFLATHEWSSLSFGVFLGAWGLWDDLAAVGCLRTSPFRFLESRFLPP